MNGAPNGNGYEREKLLMERDDRGVFGPEGFTLSASLRRKYKTALLPVRARAWQFMREQKFDEAEALLLQSLPRNAADLEDERYFGMYCGLADIALKKEDKVAALDWFRRGIESFPSAVRKNHLLQLADMGIDVAQWISTERDDGLSETDAAAVLQRVHAAMEPLAKGNHETARAGNRVAQESRRLETGGTHVTRSNVRGYLG